MYVPIALVTVITFALIARVTVMLAPIARVAVRCSIICVRGLIVPDQARAFLGNANNEFLQIMYRESLKRVHDCTA